MRHNITSKQVVYWFREFLKFFLKNKSPAMYEGPKNCYDKYRIRLFSAVFPTYFIRIGRGGGDTGGSSSSPAGWVLNRYHSCISVQTAQASVRVPVPVHGDICTGPYSATDTLAPLEKAMRYGTLGACYTIALSVRCPLSINKENRGMLI